MITSSVLNSVTFKNLDGGNPNKWNTLYANRKHGGFTIRPYCQRFNKDDIVYLQFVSDSNTVPELKIYIPQLNDTVNGTLASSYTGVDNRYFFNFEITLGADYYNKKISFILTQGTDTLQSEPIYCEDLSEELNAGVLKRIKYTNLDRNNSDLSDYWIDWSAVSFMYFYVEAVDVNPEDTEEIEVLEGSQSKTIITASNYSGINLQTDGIPDYLLLKLKAASSLDFFEVNGIQYIKEGEVETSRQGNSTLHEANVNLTEKNTVGLNVDDLGITLTDSETVIIPKRNTNVNSSGWQVANPEGFMLHSVLIRHAATSTGDAIVKLGITVDGDELIDEVMGNIPLADYPDTDKFKAFPLHYLKDDSAYTLYVSVSGTGAVLDIIINFDTITES